MKIRYKNNRVKGDYDIYMLSYICHRNRNERKKKIKKSSSGI